MNAHERFIGFLIEHYAGNFPLWLAPDQMRVLTLNDDEALSNYAKPNVAELRVNMVRVEADFSAMSFKVKIRQGSAYASVELLLSIDVPCLISTLANTSGRSVFDDQG